MVWPTQTTGWLAGWLVILEHKLVFSNHSDLYFIFISQSTQTEN